MSESSRLGRWLPGDSFSLDGEERLQRAPRASESSGDSLGWCVRAPPLTAALGVARLLAGPSPGLRQRVVVSWGKCLPLCPAGKMSERLHRHG